MGLLQIVRMTIHDERVHVHLRDDLVEHLFEAHDRPASLSFLASLVVLSFTTCRCARICRLARAIRCASVVGVARCLRV
jgi:hypothetical protein